jgi:GNAT superfamily N-acetyltransferase
MTFDNMVGVDRYFTKMVRNPLGRWFTFVTLPLYLRFSGQGFKVVVDDDIAGCGFLDMRDHSGYIFNINVSRPFRRQGLGRQLMMHLESVITRKGQAWAALQVDRGNVPAEQLYRQLGYRVYHPHFMRREISPSISRAPTAGVSLQQMERHRGRGLYKRYQNLERQNGDFSVAPVVDEYDSWSGMRGTFWRCLLYDREIGCGQFVKRSGQPLIRLAMAPAYWGHLATGGIVKALVDSLPGRPAYVDLFLESSAHHRAAEPILNGLGFRQRLRSRMLMLKPLSGDPPGQ